MENTAEMVGLFLKSTLALFSRFNIPINSFTHLGVLTPFLKSIITLTLFYLPNRDNMKVSNNTRSLTGTSLLDLSTV